MSGYYKKTPWTQKPPMSVGPRRGHWTTKHQHLLLDFREGAGGVVHDRSGHGFDGDISGQFDTSTAWQASEKGLALTWDGNNDYFTVGDAATYAAGQDFSLHVLWKFNNFTGIPVPLYTGGYQISGWYIQVNTAGRILFRSNKSGPGVTTDTTSVNGALTAGTWHMVSIVGVYDELGDGKTRLHIYVDGEDVTDVQGAHGFDQPGSNLCLGRYNLGGFQGYYFDGQMSLVASQDFALSQGAVQRLHANPNLIYEPRKTFIPAGGIIASTGSMILRLLKLRNK